MAGAAMTSTSVVLAIQLASLAALLLIVSGGVDACAGVPTMTSADACDKACGGQTWYYACPATLRNAPETAEVTVFALVAARLAKLKYEDTMAEVDRTLAGGSAALTAAERAAAERCRARYGEARGAIASVADDLSRCDSGSARRELRAAVGAVQSCRDGIVPSYRGLARLNAMVVADRDLTMVAYGLGALAVGK